MTVGFGILGAGMISGLHADALENSGKARLAAVCDVARERAEKLAHDFAPDAKVYTALDAMLADPAVDVVDVVTPNSLHTDAVLAAIKAGKHVLCEKPPAMSLRDTGRMIEAARQANRKLGIFVQCRLREPIQQMKRALDQGRFGRLLRADAVMKWYRSTEYYLSDAWRSQRQSGAGVTIQHAFHYVDLLQYLVGPAESVQARMTNLGHPRNSDRRHLGCIRAVSEWHDRLGSGQHRTMAGSRRAHRTVRRKGRRRHARHGPGGVEVSG